MPPFNDGYNFQMIEKVKSIVALAQSCSAASVGTPACEDFWFWTAAIIAVIGIAGLGFMFAMVLGRCVRVRARRATALWEAEMRRQDEVAPELRMQHVAWKGDAAPEQDEREVAEQIRQALRNRKINGSD